MKLISSGPARAGSSRQEPSADAEQPPPHAEVAEVVRVPGVAPQPAVHDLARFAGSALKRASCQSPTDSKAKPTSEQDRADHGKRAGRVLRACRAGPARWPATGSPPAAGRPCAARTGSFLPRSISAYAGPPARRGCAGRCRRPAARPTGPRRLAAGRGGWCLRRPSEDEERGQRGRAMPMPQAVSTTECLPARRATTKVTPAGPARARRPPRSVSAVTARAVARGSGPRPSGPARRPARRRPGRAARPADLLADQARRPSGQRCLEGVQPGPRRCGRSAPASPRRRGPRARRPPAADRLADRPHVHVGGDVGLDERAAAGRPCRAADICWTSSRPPGRSRRAARRRRPGSCAAPTCSPISIEATASNGPSGSTSR